MNFILVPVDFSEASDNAANYAIGLGAEMGAKVLFMHVVAGSTVEPTQDYHPLKDRDTNIREDQFPDLVRAVEDKLKNYAEAMQERGRDAVKCYYAIKRGEIVNAIQELNNEEPVDLVVMGTQGASGWKKTFVGTTTTKVIEDLDIPVLAIPINAQYRDVNRILFAEDLENDELHTLSQLEKFADRMDAEVMVMHVYDSEKDREKRSSDFQQQFKTRFKHRKLVFKDAKNDDVLEALEQTARREKVDIIAMQTRKRTFMESLFDKSLTKKLAYHTDVPLLAMHL